MVHIKIVSRRTCNQPSSYNPETTARCRFPGGASLHLAAHPARAAAQPAVARHRRATSRPAAGLRHRPRVRPARLRPAPTTARRVPAHVARAILPGTWQWRELGGSGSAGVVRGEGGGLRHRPHLRPARLRPAKGGGGGGGGGAIRFSPKSPL